MYYTTSHEWIKLREDEATIGISTPLQKQLDEIVYIELPKIGYEVKASDEVAVLESTKAAIDITSPLSGIITEINLNLKTDPNLLAASPEDEGWIFKIKITNPSELEELLSPDSYQDIFINH